MIKQINEIIKNATDEELEQLLDSYSKAKLSSNEILFNVIKNELHQRKIKKGEVLYDKGKLY